jgi:hypothetical protein
MGIKDDYESFCFDEAVTEFGYTIKNQLDKVKGKNDKSTQGQRDALLRRLLGDAPAEQAKFATPIATREAKPKKGSKKK